MLSPESHPTFAINLVNMLSQWMVWFPSDFRDESMINRAKQMVKKTMICLYFSLYTYQWFIFTLLFPR